MQFSSEFRLSSFSYLSQVECREIFNKIKHVIFQIVHQFPCSFEFNDRFLTFLSDNAYNSDFGTFLADSDYERVKVKKLQKNWGHLLRTSACGWSDIFSKVNTKQGDQIWP